MKPTKWKGASIIKQGQRYALLFGFVTRNKFDYWKTNRIKNRTVRSQSLLPNDAFFKKLYQQLLRESKRNKIRREKEKFSLSSW
jgi:hypothetical protein